MESKLSVYERYAGIPGLTLYVNFIDRQYEDMLLQCIDAEKWSTIISRRTQEYGFSYDFKKKKASKALSPLPMPLKELMEKVSEMFKADFNTLSVNEYTRKQGISKHTDPEIFGPVVAFLTLGSGDVMEMMDKSTFKSTKFQLPPRSLLFMKGEARSDWQHGIPARAETFDNNGVRIVRPADFRRVEIIFRAYQEYGNSSIV